MNVLMQLKGGRNKRKNERNKFRDFVINNGGLKLSRNCIFLSNLNFS